MNLLHTLIYQLDRVIHFRKILEMAVHISPPSYYLVLKMQAIASACSDIVLLLMEVKSAQGSLVAVLRGSLQQQQPCFFHLLLHKITG